MLMHKRLLGTVLAVAILPAGVLATTAPSPAQTYPGGSGVANVSVANGDVTVVRADSGEQVAAMVNAPVLPGDYVATGSNAEAEVQFDGISMLRFAPNTQVRFIRLDPGAREMQLASGTVDLAELQGIDGSPQVDTPSVTVRPNQRGDYRVSVLGNGQTLVTVRSGSATIADGSGARTLTPGTTVVASGQYSNAPIETQGAIGYDTFDQFNAARDQSLASAYNSNPYLSPQLAGYTNFANYGQWHNVAGYGERGPRTIKPRTTSLRIKMDSGFGSPATVIRGSTTNPGDTRRLTTEIGFTTAIRADGCGNLRPIKTK